MIIVSDGMGGNFIMMLPPDLPLRGLVGGAITVHYTGIYPQLKTPNYCVNFGSVIPKLMVIRGVSGALITVLKWIVLKGGER